MKLLVRTIVMTGAVLVLTSLALINADAGEARGAWTLTGGTLRLDGAISAGDGERFRTLFVEALLAVPHPAPVVLELNSRGGNVRAALEIVGTIGAARRENSRVVTVVRSGGRCFSACVLVFAAGDVRRAAPDALFLFHGFRTRGMAAPVDHDGPAIAGFLAVIAAADTDLADFLRQARVLEDDVDVAFPASLLRERFPRFVSGYD